MTENDAAVIDHARAVFAFVVDNKQANNEEFAEALASSYSLSNPQNAEMYRVLKKYPDYIGTRRVETVDLTPSWSGIMPGLIDALQNGTPEGKRLAKEELMGLARKVDEINAATKAAKISS